MKRSFNDNSTDKLRLERAMKGVVQQLAAMAPNPDRKNHNGPCFVKQDVRVSTGNDHEAMLGSFLLEAMLGVALGDAFADIAMNVPDELQQVDWGNVVDIYDEYVSDRSNSGFSLGKKGSINGTFNSFSSTKAAPRQVAFEQSLTERMKLEETYAGLSRDLDKYDSPSAPAMAA